MPKRSNFFQKLVFIVRRQIAPDSKVTESEELTDLVSGGKREVDICIRHPIPGGQTLIISIECTSKGRKNDVTWVEQLIGKHQRLATNLLILVSPVGFSAEARRIAQTHPVELMTLQQVAEGGVQGLLRGLRDVWFKESNLVPTQVTIGVGETEGLPSERFIASPDNGLYRSDGREIGFVRQLVDYSLKMEPVNREIFGQAEEWHKGFEIRLEDPTDAGGSPLFVLKLEPTVLRRVEFIRIIGRFELKVSHFALSHGTLGAVEVSWGEGDFHGQRAVLVATKDETDKTRLTLTILDPRLPGSAQKVWPRTKEGGKKRAPGK